MYSNVSLSLAISCFMIAILRLLRTPRLEIIDEPRKRVLSLRTATNGTEFSERNCYYYYCYNHYITMIAEMRVALSDKARCESS